MLATAHLSDEGQSLADANTWNLIEVVGTPVACQYLCRWSSRRFDQMMLLLRSHFSKNKCTCPKQILSVLDKGEENDIAVSAVQRRQFARKNTQVLAYTQWHKVPLYIITTDPPFAIIDIFFSALNV